MWAVLTLSAEQCGRYLLCQHSNVGGTYSVSIAMWAVLT